jgi:hypothetical protein
MRGGIINVSATLEIRRDEMLTIDSTRRAHPR